VANDVLRIYQRSYPQIQTAFDAIPNSAGAATVAGSDCCLIESLTTDADQAEIARTDKTGTLDAYPTQGGRRTARGQAVLSMAGNGAAGVAPDCKNYLQAAFGKAPTISAGTSVLYTLDDLLYYLAIWNFNQPNTAEQMCAFNSLINKMVVEFGGDEPKLTFGFESGWVLTPAQIGDSNTDPLAKGGLTAFPNEPASPVVNGTFPPGFQVTATLDGTAYTTLLTGRITLDIGRELRKDTNSAFPRQGVPGPRKVTVDFSLTDDDSAALTGLKVKAYDRTPVNVEFAIGTVAGNTWDWLVKNVILAKPKYGDEGIRRKVDFSGSMAYPTSVGAKDHLQLTIR